MFSKNVFSCRETLLQFETQLLLLSTPVSSFLPFLSPPPLTPSSSFPFLLRFTCLLFPCLTLSRFSLSSSLPFFFLSPLPPPEMCPGDDLQECGQGVDNVFPLEEWSDEWEDGVLSGDCVKGGKLAPGRHTSCRQMDELTDRKFGVDGLLSGNCVKGGKLATSRQTRCRRMDGRTDNLI